MHLTFKKKKLFILQRWIFHSSLTLLSKILLEKLLVVHLLILPMFLECQDPLPHMQGPVTGH